jgi:hypothetical protein
MFSTAAIGLGLLSSMPVIPDTAPTYKDFVTGLCADEAPGDVTDIFGSWRYDSDSDSIPSLELGQYMELASPPDSVLATPVFNSFATALSDTLVMDLSFNTFNDLEFDQSFGDHTDFFDYDDTPCPMRTLLDISDIADVAPPIITGLAHLHTCAASSGRRNPVGSILEGWCGENNVLIPIPAVEQVSLVRKDAIRRPRDPIPDRKVTPVRPNAFKRFASNLHTLVSLVRRNVTRRNDL